MKREEKNLQSRQRILAAAVKEFGEKSFAEASLNTVCAQGEISKGIIYHYFKDKDELFLACVDDCMQALTAYLEAHVQANNAGIEKGIEAYFQARITFFDQNPLYLKLFCTGIIVPPKHLEKEVEAYRAVFDKLNIRVLTGLLQGVQLRDGIAMDTVIALFRFYQDFINTRYNQSGSTDIWAHEKNHVHALNILLYGVVEKEELHD